MEEFYTDHLNCVCNPITSGLPDISRQATHSAPDIRGTLGFGTVAILQPAGVVARKPFNVSHSVKGLSDE